MTSKSKNMAIGRRAKRLWSGFKGLFRKPPPPEIALAPRFERLEEAIRALRVEFSSQLSFHTYDLAEELQANLDTTRTTLAAEVASKINDLSGSALGQRIEAIASGVQQLGNSSFELTNRVIGLDTGLNSRLNSTDNKVFELDNKVAGSAMGLQSRLNEVENSILSKSTSVDLTPVQNAVQAASQLTAQARLEAANRFAEIENVLLSRLNEIETRTFEHTNHLITLQSEAQSRLGDIRSASSELRNALAHLDSGLNTRLNEVVVTHLPAVIDQIHEAANLQIAAIEDERVAPEAARTQRPAPAKIEGFDAVLARAKQDFPTVYGEWRSRLDTMGAAFDETKVGNAAHAGDPYSRLFRSFVARHIRGPVLDVGCGPFGRPYYLTGYPAKLISGLEPLPFPPNDEIHILRGISEYLPWADGAFDTVISGTSLDHCLSLDRSLDEMFRVLAADGVTLLWLGNIPGSPQFKPLDPAFKPADQFHLFHFDSAWFEPMLNRRFEIVDRVKLDRPSYSHIFYALRPIPGSAPYDQSGARGAAKAVDAGGKGRKVTAGGT